LIRTENAQLAAWVYVDIDLGKRDLGGYVAEARQAVAEKVHLPTGYQITWSGSLSIGKKTLPRLIAAIAVTIVLIILLLYMGTGSWFRVAIVCWRAFQPDWGLLVYLSAGVQFEFGRFISA